MVIFAKILARHFTWGYFSRYHSYFLHKGIWVIFSRGGNFRKKDKCTKKHENFHVYSTCSIKRAAYFPTFPFRASNYLATWSYSWSKIDGFLPEGRVRYMDLNRVMLIESVMPEDDGTYQCEVTRGASRATKLYTLRLEG